MRSITLHLPVDLYDHFKRRAHQTHRSVEAELLDAVSTAAPNSEALPAEVAEALKDLEALGDEALWQVARESFPEDATARLEALNLKQQREGLEAEEKEILARLLQGYERVLVLKSEAAWLLKQRGHDVSGLRSRR